MSVRIQCCSLIVLLILMFFQGRQRQTHLLTERVFRWVLGTCLVCLLLDVASVLAINYVFNAPAGANHNMPTLVVDLICKGYLLTLLGMGISTLLYICADLDYAHPQRLRNRATTFGTIGLIGMVLILLLPIEYHRNELGVVTNTDGPSVYATYAFIIIYLVFILCHLFLDRAKMNHRRRTAILVWMALWMGCFAIQLMDNSLLLAGFACSAGALVIYLSLENPEGNLDRQSGLFRRDVLKSYLRQLYGQERDFSVLVLLFDRGQELRRGQESTEAVRLDLLRYLEGQKSWMVFKESDEQIYMVFDTPQQAQKAMKQVNAHLARRRQSADALPVKIHWLYMPSALVAEGRDDLLFLMREIARKHIPALDQVLVDAKIVQDIRRDQEIERLLTAAMAEDRIEVFYQPIYSIPLGRVTGAEALVRIRDEQGRLVPPGLFIPIAENNGMILRLGKMIFEHVCLFIKAHPLEELGLTHIDVNLSVVQCSHADLAMDYMDIMRRYGIDPKQINLEITESASIDAKNLLLTNMDKLINFGVSFALDDFGTGQSNLNYIMDMPVEVAKFDREMTQAYFANEKAKQIMTAAVRMIHDMGLKIVSEGVETAEEYQAIVALGIEYIQGYYFSKPLPEEEFLAYLKGFQSPALPRV